MKIKLIEQIRRAWCIMTLPPRSQISTGQHVFLEDNTGRRPGVDEVRHQMRDGSPDWTTLELFAFGIGLCEPGGLREEPKPTF